MTNQQIKEKYKESIPELIIDFFIFMNPSNGDSKNYLIQLMCLYYLQLVNKYSIVDNINLL